jgi:hypothetical protein
MVLDDNSATRPRCLANSVNDLHQGLTVANDQAAWLDADGQPLGLLAVTFG